MHAVIMTGGKGTRLRPYTKVLPKGLLPVGEQPILELIIKQLEYFGFTKLTLACGYLMNIIQTYFGNGSEWGVNITYQEEEKPLGTAGPLALLPKQEETFLVINCDVLTNLNFQQLFDFHQETNSLITIASQQKKLPIDLGVLVHEKTDVIDFVEKPKQSVLVSMGIYIMSPEVLQHVPQNQFFDIPDLILTLISQKKKVSHFQNEAYWLDIGSPAEYERANEEIQCFQENHPWT